ncbi:hypothetical protein ACFE04_004627 [Oxalis oulophora]
MSWGQVSVYTREPTGPIVKVGCQSVRRGPYEYVGPNRGSGISPETLAKEGDLKINTGRASFAGENSIRTPIGVVQPLRSGEGHPLGRSSSSIDRRWVNDQSNHFLF